MALVFKKMGWITVPNEELIDDIGESLGFKMWNKRDKTKKYDTPGDREDGEDWLHADNYMVGEVITFKKLPLLVYQHKSSFGDKSYYTFNLLTMRPTKTSHSQVQLSKELVAKIKASRDAVFIDN